MRKIREVLRLKYELGFTHRTIAKALRVAVGTVSEYLAKAKKGGLSWPLPEELSDGELEAGCFRRRARLAHGRVWTMPTSTRS